MTSLYKKPSNTSLLKLDRRGFLALAAIGVVSASLPSCAREDQISSNHTDGLLPSELGTLNPHEKEQLFDVLLEINKKWQLLSEIHSLEAIFSG